MIKYYIASRLENAESVKLTANVLNAVGWQQTYDWTTHGSVQNQGEKRITEVSQKEMQGVLDADVVIVMLPGGRGTHTELGAAIASGKKIFLYTFCRYYLRDDSGRTCSFYSHPAVETVIGGKEILIYRLMIYTRDFLAEKNETKYVCMSCGKSDMKVIRSDDFYCSLCGGKVKPILFT